MERERKERDRNRKAESDDVKQVPVWHRFTTKTQKKHEMKTTVSKAVACRTLYKLEFKASSIHVG